MIENEKLDRGFGGGTEDLTPGPFPFGKGGFLIENVMMNHGFGEER